MFIIPNLIKKVHNTSRLSRNERKNYALCTKCSPYRKLTNQLNYYVVMNKHSAGKVDEKTNFHVH